NPPRLFRRLSLAAAVLLPLTVMAIRLARGVLADPPGEMPPFVPAAIFSLLVLAPFGFIYGNIYNQASVLFQESRGRIRGSITRIYVLESVGSLAGALVFSFLLLRFLPQLQAALVLALFFISLSLWPSRWNGKLVFSLVLLSAAWIAVGGYGSRLDERTIQAVFPGYRLRAFLSSKYGELVAVSQEETISYFSGGSRLFSDPEPERIEETIHLPLLIHPHPREIMLIGCGLGGGWEEALKHPSVTTIDCVELDGALIDLTRRMDKEIPRGEGTRKISGPERGRSARVSFHAVDGRFFLARPERDYDVIIVHAPVPLNLQWNRYFTREFFELASRALSPGGILAISHPSAENFLFREQAEVLRIIQLTLESVFAKVLILPGTTAYFIAGDTVYPPSSILEQVTLRALETNFMNENYLPYRISSSRIDFLRESLSRGEDLSPNTDGRPALTFYEQLLEGKRTGWGFIHIFGRLRRISPFLISLVPLVAVISLLLLTPRRAVAKAAVFSVGMGSILFQLTLLLTYQTFCGLLYYSLVLLTAIFMAGAAAGAAFRFPAEGRRSSLLGTLHRLFMIVVLTFPAWLWWVQKPGFSVLLATAGFMSYSLLGGLLTGAYYRTVVHSAFRTDGKTVPAVFYAWDLFGACGGGLLGGFILFPLAGISGVILFLAFFHLVAGTVIGRRL
nr:hypothetical protein [Candidatus Krumholzibacteriota bacterium]